MNEYLIALGSSLEPRQSFIRQACQQISERIGPIRRQSPLYETSPVGQAKEAFLNGALIVETDYGPETVLRLLLEVESDLGRTREVHWGDRTIDLDIIIWKNAAGEFPSLTRPNLNIPHVHCTERDFVLVPACDIARDWLCATSQRSLKSHLDDLNASTILKKWRPFPTPIKHQNSEKD
jgi:2-amino-4-hydroxy-6-hydroxymethyldihydropteridine diphosphokinase